MQTSNVDLIKSLYAAFGRGDMPAILSMLAPDVTWHVTGRTSDYPLFVQVQGIPAVEAFFKGVGANEEMKSFAMNEFHADSDTVVVIGHYDSIMKSTGKPVSTDQVHVFTIRGGKIVAFRQFLDTAQVAEAYRG